eukprot:2290593-Pyramimonas_sp.AAC.1
MDGGFALTRAARGGPAAETPGLGSRARWGRGRATRRAPLRAGLLDASCLPPCAPIYTGCAAICRRLVAGSPSGGGAWAYGARIPAGVVRLAQGMRLRRGGSRVAGGSVRRRLLLRGVRPYSACIA